MPVRDSAQATQRFRRGTALPVLFLALACGSDSESSAGTAVDGAESAGLPGAVEGETKLHDGAGELPSTSGDLPNLSRDPVAQQEPSVPADEPASCQVGRLRDCVSAAIDALADCLPAHGGDFDAEGARCLVSTSKVVVEFESAVPRWGQPSPLAFSILVADATCGRYLEHLDDGSFPVHIELEAPGYSVEKVEEDGGVTLRCNDASAHYVPHELSWCADGASSPTPELVSQTRDGSLKLQPLDRPTMNLLTCRFPRDNKEPLRDK